MQYKDLNLTIKQTYETIEVNGQEIKVLQYLPIEDKNDLVQITLQQSEESGIYNEYKLQVFFNLNLIYMYTDLVFTDEEKANYYQLYDELNTNDIFDKVIDAIPDKEYYGIRNAVAIMIKRNEEFKGKAAALIQSLIQDLPANAQAAAKIVDNFDPEKYQNVINFAKAANGGREIPQN